MYLEILVLLCTKVVKVESIDCVAQFFLDHLAFFFVPAGVGLMTSVGLLEGNVLKLLFICIASTFVVIGVTGLVVQALIRRKEKKLLGDEVNE